MAYEGQRSGSGGASEILLQGGEVCVLKCREEMILEGQRQHYNIYRIVDAIRRAYGGAPSRRKGLSTLGFGVCNQGRPRGKMGLGRQERIESSLGQPQGGCSGPYHRGSRSTPRLRLGDYACLGWSCSSVSLATWGGLGTGSCQ